MGQTAAQRCANVNSRILDVHRAPHHTRGVTPASRTRGHPGVATPGFFSFWRQSSTARSSSSTASTCTTPCVKRSGSPRSRCDGSTSMASVQHCFTWSRGAATSTRSSTSARSPVISSRRDPVQSRGTSASPPACCVWRPSVGVSAWSSCRVIPTSSRRSTRLALHGRRTWGWPFRCVAPTRSSGASRRAMAVRSCDHPAGRQFRRRYRGTEWDDCWAVIRLLRVPRRCAGACASTSRACCRWSTCGTIRTRSPQAAARRSAMGSAPSLGRSASPTSSTGWGRRRPGSLAPSSSRGSTLRR